MSESILGPDDFVKSRQVLAGLAAQARVLQRRGLQPVIIADDDDAPALPGAGREAPPISYHLTYVDQKGYESQRVVTLRRIDPARAGLRLVCWCHAAQEARTFWAHQIQEVFCVVTGEVHEDAVAFFSQHPMLVEPRDPEGYALKVCQYEVNLLAIVGSADGVFDPDEQDRVLIHVFDRMPDLRLDEDVLRHRLALLTPDHDAYERSLHQLGRFRAGDPVMLMRSLRKLVDADGKCSREEVLFVSEIQDRLSTRLEDFA